MSSYEQHGSQHGPYGSDPSNTDVWHNVGGSDVFQSGSTCPFVHGSNAGATGSVPHPVPMRFRLSTGPPNLLVYNYATYPPLATGVDTYTKHQIEIQGDVTGLVIGQTVFVIPYEFQHDYDMPFHTHDIYGAYVPCRLLKTGEFVWGQV